MEWDGVLDVVKNGLLVTGLVMVMMMAIEYINVKSAGKWFASLQKSSIKQVLLASLLGIFPGCAGGFAAVSLYSHRLISIGALVAAMIASSGDEAFVILAMVPKDGAILFGVLLMVAIATGWVVDKLSKKPMSLSCDQEFEIHPSHCHAQEVDKSENSSAKWKKMVVAAALLFFGIALITGGLEHDHHHHELHEGGRFSLLDERWINILFGVIAIVIHILTLRSSNHFVQEHIWNHVIKKHFLSILLWTLGALAVIEVALHYLHVEQWIENNIYLVIVIAALVGIIPESGPHLLFVTLFSSGVVPFSVLLANSISQDGHTALPLLASDKKSFIKTKLINLFVAILVGSVVALLS